MFFINNKRSSWSWELKQALSALSSNLSTLAFNSSRWDESINMVFFLQIFITSFNFLRLFLNKIAGCPMVEISNLHQFDWTSRLRSLFNSHELKNLKGMGPKSNEELLRNNGQRSENSLGRARSWAFGHLETKWLETKIRYILPSLDPLLFILVNRLPPIGISWRPELNMKLLNLFAPPCEKIVPSLS